MGDATRNPFLVTCEHASNRLPARYGTLGLDPARLGEHIAWDPGSREIARVLAGNLHCPFREGRYTRLLIDLNRSRTHPKLIARRSFGVDIPGNQNMTPGERQRRIDSYWLPYREDVLAEIGAIIGRAGRCIHFGVHTFTPVVDGVERDTCAALLYDPSRRLEVEIVKKMQRSIKAREIRVRRNYPYRGISDGLITHCRGRYAARSYIGIEIEVSQQLVQSDAQLRPIAECIASAAYGSLPPAFVTPSR